MRIESSLFSSREGISAHGQAIAVIGDNISNANTVGFRHSRVQFGDIVAGGRATTEISNIPSTGSGVVVQGVRPVQETGVIEATGRSLDVAIEGRGFFMVGTAEDPSYTRNGNFYVSEEGVLVNGNGNQVLGFASGDENTLSTLSVNNLSLNGSPTTAATITGNLDAQLAIKDAAPTAPATFREIGEQANFVSNLTVFDSLGAQHQLTMAYTKTGPNTWTAQAYIDGDEVGGTDGVPVQVGGNAILSFQNDGTLLAADRANALINAAPAYSNGAAAGAFTIDLGGTTQFAGTTQLSSISQDGQSSGNVLDYEIRKNGEFYANLDSGQAILIGTLRLADFVNVDGLQRAGNGLFVAKSATGERRLGTPGDGGLGTLAGSSLERSTVDIANQFVDLVLYQRGYQASSQTLSAASQLIRDTIALIR